MEMFVENCPDKKKTHHASKIQFAQNNDIIKLHRVYLKKTRTKTSLASKMLLELHSTKGVFLVDYEFTYQILS